MKTGAYNYSSYVILLKWPVWILITIDLSDSKYVSGPSAHTYLER